MSEKPRCKAKTKAGKACKSPPIKGAEYCLSHTPQDQRGSVRFGGPQPGSGRPRNPRPLEVLRGKVEAEIEKWLAPYEEALDASAGIVVGTGPNATLEILPDYNTRMRAATAVLDRVYGRPKQTTELTGEGGGPIQTQELIPSDADWHTQVAEVLEEARAAASSARSDTD